MNKQTVKRYEYDVDKIASRIICLYMCANGDEFMYKDDEETMCYQGQRWIKYEDAKTLAVETARHVTVFTDWFFTWDSACEFMKKHRIGSLCVSFRKLPLIGYLVIRTVI